MKQKDILFVLILTFVVILVWIILNIVHKQNTSTISEELTEQIVPIVPSFDTNTINSLKERDQVQPLYTLSSTASASASAALATPLTSPTPSSTLSPSSSSGSAGIKTP